MAKNPWGDIAKRIYRNRFGAYGEGNFDLSVNEFAEVLRIAVCTDKTTVDLALSDYYDAIK